jgi:uncharacterized protein (DUF885 family)
MLEAIAGSLMLGLPLRRGQPARGSSLAVYFDGMRIQLQLCDFVSLGDGAAGGRGRVRRCLWISINSAKVRQEGQVKKTLRILCIYLGLAGVAGIGHTQPGGVEVRRQALKDLLAEQWAYTMQTNPEWASVLGDKRWNDKLHDFSQEAIDRNLEMTKKFLRRFEAFDTSGFPKQEVLNQKLMVRNLRLELEGARFKPWEMPVSQFGGIHIRMPDMVSVLSFESVKDYEDYIARLKAMPLLFDQTEIQMRKGMADGLMPPRYLLEKVVEQSNRVAAQEAEKTPFARPFAKFPSSMSEAEQKRLTEQGLAAIRGGIIPAYVKFTTFVREEYVPKGRTDSGVWALPDGAARYRFAVKSMTTTDRSPEEIHELGLKEVAAIEAEMLAIAEQLGYKDLASLNDHIKNDRKFYATSGQQVLDLYKEYTGGMEPELPKLFGRLPKNKLEVIPMEAARAKDAVPADYTDGATDGSRPGHINVNEYDPEHRLTLNIEAIAYHEGIPGHHLQISIGQELKDLPDFRRNGGYTAFVEGWALYSERLGKEVGKYQDPYSNYGRLENEMWRAIRLVVDTGVHEKHWSREKMVEYFHRYTAMDEPNVQTEVDRYIAWPGQALAYKLGQMAILRLRETAKKQLGDKFDIRAFHDEVLGNGALPLDVLDQQMADWIKANQ